MIISYRHHAEYSKWSIFRLILIYTYAGSSLVSHEILQEEEEVEREQQQQLLYFFLVDVDEVQLLFLSCGNIDLLISFSDGRSFSFISFSSFHNCVSSYLSIHWHFGSALYVDTRVVIWLIASLRSSIDIIQGNLVNFLARMERIRPKPICM
jgi:hypothetical protein